MRTMPQRAQAQPGHTHRAQRSRLWLAAALVLCPCHLPILLAIAGTGALGGVLARNQTLLFVALAGAFAFALWRYLTTRPSDSCPACRAEKG